MPWLREWLALMEQEPNADYLKSRLNVGSFNLHDYWSEPTGRPTINMKDAINLYGSVFVSHGLYVTVAPKEVGCHAGWNRSDFRHEDGLEPPGARRLRSWIKQALAFGDTLEAILIFVNAHTPGSKTDRELVRFVDFEGDVANSVTSLGQVVRSF